MNKTVVGVIVAIVAIGGITGAVLKNKKDSTSSNTSDHSAMEKDANPFTKNNDQSKAEVQSGSVSMDIKDFAFSQKTLKIKKGTQVTWTNRDSAKHDITPDKQSEDFKNSELLAKDASYNFTFNTVGTYAYHCSPHPYMKATIEVVE